MQKNFSFNYKKNITNNNILTNNNNNNKITIYFELKPNPLFLSLTLDKNITIKTLDEQCGNEIYGMSQSLEANLNNKIDRKEYCYLMKDKYNPYNIFKLRKKDKPFQIFNLNQNLSFFYIPLNQYKNKQKEIYNNKNKFLGLLKTHEVKDNKNYNNIKIKYYFKEKTVYKFSKRKKVFVLKNINLNDNYFWISESKKNPYEINDIIYFGNLTERTKFLNIKEKEKKLNLFEIYTLNKKLYVFQVNKKEDYLFIKKCFNIVIEKNKIIDLERMFYHQEFEFIQKNEIYFQFFIANCVNNFNYLISNYYSRKLFFNCFHKIKNYNEIINNIINYQIFIKNKKFDKVLVLYKQISGLLKNEEKEIISQDEKNLFIDINSKCNNIISKNINLNHNNNNENNFIELLKIDIFNNIFNNIINKYYKSLYNEILFNFQNNKMSKNLKIFKKNLSYLLSIYYMKNFNFNCKDVLIINQ